MRDVFGSGTCLGYCTNVHSGATFEQMLANLETYAVRVREQVCPSEPMGVGLWLSSQAAREVVVEGRLSELRDWLVSNSLLPFTFNGFPYGDFHEPVVKQKVYHPDWSDRRRLDYTLDLANILACLLPEGGEGSISTLPLGWGKDYLAAPEKASLAAANLHTLATQLARIEAERGRLIHVDLEPEPGCRLTTSADVVEFFEGSLLGGTDDEQVRRHIRVCHDVCHSAVMFEEQAAVLEKYQRAGIAVGKVQLSSAIRVRFDDSGDREECIRQLASFAEDRYLHQTVVRPANPGDPPRFIDDLPRALELAAADANLYSEWRVHFHVPLFLERFGLVETMQQAVLDCLAAVRRYSAVQHFEVETYAWTVLPEELRENDLARGIAREMQWVRRLR